MFTDGDIELAQAIKDTWPTIVHLLCTFHISENITRALVGSLRASLWEFTNDLWRVSSIEDVAEFEMEFSTLKQQNPIFEFSRKKRHSGHLPTHTTTSWQVCPLCNDMRWSIVRSNLL